jgi:hypothetical protein
MVVSSAVTDLSRTTAVLHDPLSGASACAATDRTASVRRAAWRSTAARDRHGVVRAGAVKAC